MSRYIEVGHLKKSVEGLQDCYNGFSDTYDKACIIGLIDEEPTADVVPVVHGKWVFSKIDDMFFCTNCKNGSVRNDYPYCHWCGTKMDEKVSE